jgi:hypothetical protein
MCTHLGSSFVSRRYWKSTGKVTIITYTMQAYRGSRCIAPIIFKLNTRWRVVVLRSAACCRMVLALQRNVPSPSLGARNILQLSAHAMEACGMEEELEAFLTLAPD